MAPTPRPPKFPVELDDPQRAALERIRIKLGARSAADAIRKLIEENDPERALDLSRFRADPPSRYLTLAELEAQQGGIVNATTRQLAIEQGSATRDHQPIAPAKPLSSMSGKPSSKGGKGK